MNVKRLLKPLIKFEGVREFVELWSQSITPETTMISLDVLMEYEQRFSNSVVVEKSISTRTFGTDERWTIQYLVIHRNGVMKLFDSKTSKKSNVSFDLTKKTTGDFVENSWMWHFNMQNEDGIIQIAFQSADDLHESLDSIKKFIGNQILQENDGNKGNQSFLEYSFLIF